MTIDPKIAWRFTAIIAPGGPAVTAHEARAYADQLHRAAMEAVPLVGEITGLEKEAQQASRVPVFVTDRPGWAYAAAQSLGAMAKAAAGEVSGLSSLTVGAGTAVLSRFILGQFDPYGLALAHSVGQQSARAAGGRHSVRRANAQRASEPAHLGRLLLNAPNIAAFRARYDLDQRDVCLWVCVHELTHAVQYQAAPWLGQFVVDNFAQVLQWLEQNPASEEVGSAGAGSAGAGLEALFAYEPFAQLNAVMSVLEGHAEYAMNAVNVARMPGKQRIISALDQRRHEQRPVRKKLSELFGLAKKAQQYQRGAAFTRAVIGAAGLSGFNLIWQDSQAMPTMAELRNPAAWLARMGLATAPEASVGSGANIISAPNGVVAAASAGRAGMSDGEARSAEASSAASGRKAAASGSAAIDSGSDQRSESEAKRQ